MSPRLTELQPSAPRPLRWPRRQHHHRPARHLADCLGWSDEHLRRFVIQGRQYGDGGRGDPRRVGLGDLGLRVREHFLCEYDFTDGWQHDIRVEQIRPLEPGRRYPVCSGGRRAGPPEDCGGPWAFSW